MDSEIMTAVKDGGALAVLAFVVALFLSRRIVSGSVYQDAIDARKDACARADATERLLVSERETARVQFGLLANALERSIEAGRAALDRLSREGD